MEKDFDLVVIGSGPGGYVAAIRASQLGYKTAIVEKYNVLGGTCTNVGCIPSKALLDSSENYYAILHKGPKQGILADNVRIDFEKFIARSKDVVKQNNEGLNFLMKKNKIQVFTGAGSFIDNSKIVIRKDQEEDKTISAKYFIIATGSKPASIPGVDIDKDRIITSTEALSLKTQPATMVIIGGGVIGVEMASVYSRTGTKVTIIEYTDSLIPTMDRELGKELLKVLSKQGIEILLSSKVQSAKNQGNSALVTYLDTAGKEQQVTADYCLVAVGRKPYTTGLGLENTKVKLDDKGRVVVNDQLRTEEPNIYALGDVIRGPMLAHKAEDEGVAIAETINGHPHTINYLRIPSVVYTWPEVAGSGYTEEQLKEAGIVYNKGKFPFLASGRARASDDMDGFVKVLTDPKYGEVLGVHIIGARAADLIAQGVIAMECEITDSELGKISYAHPTFSEVLKDAYLITSGRGAINI
ncbi:dihydrolipoyl dehydrogenase [Chitinophaga sp. 30R24]|uniref:dihydrolipoyl dehydrogenase n=1 Tax=Chitinophaga sp. 30R24 TaxID=3248838 RepID=UPI003B8F331C